MAVEEIGLTPIFPVMVEVPVVEIPDFARIVKLQSDFKFTGELSTGAASTPGITMTANRQIRNMVPPPLKRTFLFWVSIPPCLFIVVPPDHRISRNRRL